jgi:hypothetical protein
MHKDLIRGVASIEGDNLVVFYHPCASEIFGWSGLIREVTSIEGDNLVVFYNKDFPKLLKNVKYQDNLF